LGKAYTYLRMRFFVLSLLFACAYCYDVALVTFHGGDDKGEINNIIKYDFLHHPNKFRYAGNLLINQAVTSLRSLRGMAYDPLLDQLYYVNAYQEDSKLLRADSVSSGSAYGQVLTSTNLAHPYGIAYANNTLYISNQGTHQVTKYFTTNLQAIQPTFAAVGDPRGVALDRTGGLWVADKVTNSIIRYSPEGRPTLQVPVSWPIAVVIHNDLVYATSRDGPINVLTFDVNTGRATNRTYSAAAVTTPCGVVVHEPTNSLFVMTQKPNRIHRFNFLQRTYIGPVTDLLEDIPQHIIIVPFKDPITKVPAAKQPKAEATKDTSTKKGKDKKDKKGKDGK